MNEADKKVHWQILEEKTRAIRRLRDVEADLKGQLKDVREAISEADSDINACLDEMESNKARLPMESPDGPAAV